MTKRTHQHPFKGSIAQDSIIILILLRLRYLTEQDVVLLALFRMAPEAVKGLVIQELLR